MPLLGENRGHMPRHSKVYRNFAAEYDRLQAERIAAFSEFVADCNAGTYPEDKHVVHMDPAELDRFLRELSGSMKIQSTRPHTVAYGLNDSPVAQLAFIVEKFKDWADTDQLPEDAVDRDRILTIVMSYWLPQTGGTSAQFYYEIAEYLPVNVTTGHYDPISVPFGVAVFPHAPFAPVRRFIERDFPTLVHWSEFDRGGNFAALEEPDLYLQDVRAFRRALERSAA